MSNVAIGSLGERDWVDTSGALYSAAKLLSSLYEGGGDIQPLHVPEGDKAK